MYRLNLVKGLGPVLQIAEGYSVELPQDVHDTLDARTNPTWPTTWFAPILTGHGQFASAYDVMNSWGANHCVAAFGHIGGDLIALASLLPHSGRNAQRGARTRVSPRHLEPLRRHPRHGRRLPRLRDLWPSLWVKNSD
jgi:L-fucose isomerase-like protein